MVYVTLTAPIWRLYRLTAKE